MHWAARDACAAVELARARVAQLLGCRADEIVFTSGGSEANNSKQSPLVLGVAVNGRGAREGGLYEIVDVVIEGVSLALAQRREFVSVIEGKGMEGLSAFLGAREVALRRWAAEN